jgi:hypothetical protein
VETLAIVEHLDVIEEGNAQLRVGRPGLAVDELALQRAEEALGDGVVPAVPLAAHADLDAGLGEGLAVGAARVLASAVRMMEQSGRRIPMRQGHAERAKHQVGGDVGIDGPADDGA